MAESRRRNPFGSPDADVPRARARWKKKDLHEAVPSLDAGRAGNGTTDTLGHARFVTAIEELARRRVGCLTTPAEITFPCVLVISKPWLKFQRPERTSKQIANPTIDPPHPPGSYLQIAILNKGNMD